MIKIFNISMSTYYEYRIRCTTDNKFEYWVLKDTDAAPTTCPKNTTHTVDTTLTSIVNTIADNIVTVKEESIATGGNFSSTTVTINAIKNTTTAKTISWPYHISVLSVDFITGQEHKGDIINVAIGKDTTIGSLTTNIFPASTYTSQNYIMGQIVTHTHPDAHYGTRVYTCMINTVNNDLPTNTIYWKHGFELNVSQTVIDTAAIGFCIKLDDLVNTDDVGRVISVNTENKKIYVEMNPANSYLVSTPTYVKNTAYAIKDFELGDAWEYNIGESKIGGTHIPTDVKIELSYENKSVDTDKKFIERVEYLY